MNPADILMLLRYLEQTFEPHQIDALVTYCEAHDFTLIQGLHRLAIEGLAIDAMCPEIAEGEDDA